MRAPIPYYGGKQQMYRRITALFPLHRVYVEVFGGAASVLLNKPPSPVEVYNDVDGEVVNLFRVLREQGEELIALLNLTPYAREEFAACLDNHCDDSLERARRAFVRFRQSFAGKGQATPGRWAYSTERHGGEVGTWLSAIEYLPAIIERLRMVHIECLDFADCITRYDTPGTLFYCDPPYLATTREASSQNDVYTHEMTEAQHRQLLYLLNSVRGMVVLSGYPSTLYDTALAGWEQREYNVPAHSSSVVRTRGGKGGTAPRRTEVLWLNPAVVTKKRGMLI